MSHNLSFRNGRAAAAYGSNKPAWHGHGTVVKGLMNAEECLAKAQLDFTVGKVPLWIKNPVYDAKNNNKVPKGFKCPDNFAIVRSDLQDTQDILGVVGKQYTPVQNVDCLNILDPIVERSEAVYESAGALDGFKKIWLLAKLPEEIKVNGKDIVNNYLLVYNSHDGTTSLTVRLTPIRVVCWNTLSAAVGGTRASFTARHTKSVNERLRIATQIIGLARKRMTELSKTYNNLAQVTVNPLMLNYFLNVVFPIQKLESNRMRNIQDDVRYLFNGNATGAKLAGQTAWGLYNATTEYAEHVKGTRGNANSMQNSFFGYADRISNKALDTAMSLASTPEKEMRALVDSVN